MKPQSDEEKQKSIDEIKTKQDQKQEKLIRMYNRDQRYVPVLPHH